MPVGTVDYTSTAPWNDPLNPWPIYTQMLMTGSVLSEQDNTLNMNTILTLDAFDPLGAPGSPYPGALYSGTQAGFGNIIVIYDTQNFSGWGITITTPDFSDTYFGYALVNTRDIFKYYEWPWAWDDGSGLPSMTPVLSSVAPWEKRRIMGGTG